MWPWYIPAAPGILLGAAKWLDIPADFIDLAIIEKTVSLKEQANIITEKNPSLVAFSLFSYLSQDHAKELAQHIKEIDSNIKIIAGGPGIKGTLNTDNFNYINELIQQGVIDYYIDGDGELAWPKFLIDFFKIDKQIDFAVTARPYLPDYTKFDIDFYRKSAIQNKELFQIPITGSRGCVRKCTFCEIPGRWDFVQRSPDQIAEEIREIAKLIPEGNFHFTDSLINGSIPAFDKILDHFISIKKDYPLITWSSQFIIRDKKQCTEEYWKKIADSGCANLEIGVETGSDRLRFEMKKNFYNEDLDSSLYYMEKFNIKCSFLMFVGYPTETMEDHELTVDMFKRYQQYAGKIIRKIQLGYMFTINPGTPVYNEGIKNPQFIISKNTSIWFNKDNPTLTFEERMRRRKNLEDTLIRLGYKLDFDNHQAKLEAEENYKNNGKIIRLIEKQR
jgi:radical SAM superfamily enzyme YgiQ (UPF0313 family)